MLPFYEATIARVDNLLHGNGTACASEVQALSGTDGENGFLVQDVDEMAAAIGRLGEIDPHRCRASVAERFDVESVCAAYEQVYAEAIAGSTPKTRLAAR